MTRDDYMGRRNFLGSLDPATLAGLLVTPDRDSQRRFV